MTLAEIDARIASLEAQMMELNRTVATLDGQLLNLPPVPGLGDLRQQLINQRDAARNRYNALSEERNELKDRQQRILDAQATAISGGLSEESALKKAEAEVARSEGLKSFLKYAGIALLIIVAAWLIIRWKRKK